MIGEMFAIAAAFTVACSAILSKSLMARITPLSLQTTRIWFASLFLTIACLIIGKWSELINVSWFLVGLMALSTFIGIAIGDSLYLKVLNSYSTSITFTVAVSSKIFLTTILAGFFLGEKVNWTLGIGAVLVLAGLYLSLTSKFEVSSKLAVETAFQPKTERKLFWVLLAAFCGLCWAISFCLIQVVLRDVHPLVANTIRMPMASVMLTVLVVGIGQGKDLVITKYGKAASALIVFSGFLSYAFGLLLSLYSIKYAGVSRMAILTSISPLFVLGLSMLFLGEKPTLRLGFGILLCVSGIAVVMAK